MPSSIRFRGQWRSGESEGEPRWPRAMHGMRRSTGGGWWSWCGRDARPEELAREFEPTAQSIRNWVAQADRDEGRRRDGLTSDEREELTRLAAREPGPARRARDTSQKPRPGSRRRPARCRHGVRIRERESGQLQDRDDVPGAGGLPQRLLRVAPTAAVGAHPGGRGTQLRGCERFINARARPMARRASTPNSRQKASKWGASGWRG